MTLQVYWCIRLLDLRVSLAIVGSSAGARVSPRILVDSDVCLRKVSDPENDERKVGILTIRLD